MSDVTDFDGYNPNDPIDSQQSADRYVQWAAWRLGLFIEMRPRTSGHARAAAIYLWIVAAASLHLDDDIDEEREHHEAQLGATFRIARRVERRGDEATLETMQAAAMIADSWEPVGRYADRLLGALRCAIGSVTLYVAHPLQLKDDLAGEPAWTLVDAGLALLNEIDDADYPDFAVAPCLRIIDRAGWQRASDTAKRIGAPPPSAN